MGRIFKIGRDENDNYAVTSVTQAAKPEQESSMLRTAFNAGGFAENAAAITGQAVAAERKQGVAPRSYNDLAV